MTAQLTTAPPTVEPAARGGWIRRLGPFIMAHKRNVAIAFGFSIVGRPSRRSRR